MAKHLKLLTAKYLDEYSEMVSVDWQDVFNSLRVKDKYSRDDFDHLIRISAVYSSRIEGNSLKPSDYFSIKSNGGNPNNKKEVIEIDDLVDAYNFAIKNNLTEKNLLKSHEILSKHLPLVKPHERGKLRTSIMYIWNNEDRIEYVACEPQDVKNEFNKLFHDIKELLNRELNYKEIFYYASMIHLMFEKIHPFVDGNGRSGRLLEKWFISEKIGKNAWGIKTEKYYSIMINDYYKNIQMGLEYEATNLDKSLPFLLMLPKSLKA